MKKTFLAAVMAALFTTPISAAWTPEQNQTFVNNCVARSLAMSNIRDTWPPHLIGQVCDCIRQTVEPISTWNYFNGVFTDNTTRENAQKSVYIIATACVAMVRQQQMQPNFQQPQPEIDDNGWGDLIE
tara:strand:+ start:76 stop:459 length:384 start_codon:yes stop_codon:yes gene_type:complete